MRTSIVFFAAGATMFKIFLNDKFFMVMGELLALSSIIIAWLGIYLYLRTKRELNLKNFLPDQ